MGIMYRIECLLDEVFGTIVGLLLLLVGLIVIGLFMLFRAIIDWIFPRFVPKVNQQPSSD